MHTAGPTWFFVIQAPGCALPLLLGVRLLLVAVLLATHALLSPPSPLARCATAPQTASCLLLAGGGDRNGGGCDVGVGDGRCPLVETIAAFAELLVFIGAGVPALLETIAGFAALLVFIVRMP